MSWSRRLHRDIRRGLGNAHRYILWNLGLWRLVDIRTLWLVAVSQFVIVITICVAISAAIAVASSPPPPPPPTFCPCLANLDEYNVEYNADGTSARSSLASSTSTQRSNERASRSARAIRFSSF